MSFNERYDGEQDYFEPGNERYLASNNRQWIWETNFIPDARRAVIDAQEQKGAGVNITQFEISNNTLIGHLAEWPVGRYHKAHFHGGGAVLVVLRSEGYSLMWPNHLGTQPYENGFGDRGGARRLVPGSVFSPPTNWFHQHFNTGRGAGVAARAALRQPEVSPRHSRGGDSRRRLHFGQAGRDA